MASLSSHFPGTEASHGDSAVGGDGDWTVPTDSENDSDSDATITMNEEDAEAMAAALRVSTSTFGFPEGGRRPDVKVKTKRNLCVNVVGSPQAQEAVQDCLLKFVTQPGFKPTYGTRLSKNKEMQFVKTEMRKLGWKLWRPPVSHFNPQWIRAHACRKFVKAFTALPKQRDASSAASR